MKIFLKQKFQCNNNMNNYNSKMCTNYLSLHNIQMPESLKEKRRAVQDHKETMIGEARTFDDVKAGPLTLCFHKNDIKNNGIQ